MSAEPNVLLVEDEENVAYVVALALRHSGFEVTVVGTGAEALRLSASNPPPTSCRCSFSLLATRPPIASTT